MASDQCYACLYAEWPINCTPEDVCLILDGRKTMIRRPGATASSFGDVGDGLWVQEPWCPRSNGALLLERVQRPFYRATDGRGDIRKPDGWRWRSASKMPRRASRITLVITSIRVECLHDITAADCYEEGIRTEPSCQGRAFMPGFDIAEYGSTWDVRYRRVFARYWDEQNAKRGFGWDTNPSVVAIKFKVL